MQQNDGSKGQESGPKFVLPAHMIVRAPTDINGAVARAMATAPAHNESEATKTPAYGSLDPQVALSKSAHSFALDAAQPLDPKTFPHQPRAGSQLLPATIPNVQHLLVSYGIVARYNVTKKKLTVTMPGYTGSPDNQDNVAITQIVSLASLNGLPTGQVPSFISVVGDRNQHNPVAEWIMSKKWDGVDRLPAIYLTLMEQAGFPRALKEKLIYRWLLSTVAAALMASGFRCRGVLTLQGPQGLGKTAWVKALVPDPALCDDFIKLDHHLDAGNKDSLLSAITHWIVEIGELDSSFRKDVARLKGFLTSDRDKVRRPYARVESEYPRRTAFCATVNDANFLVDQTGNSRWWTIPVVKVNYVHGIHMQQLFAQMAVEFNAGERWWLTAEEEQMLEVHNKDHRTVSALRERILDVVDLEKTRNNLPAMTPTEVLRAIGIDRATNMQCKECGAILRDLLGEPKRINGRDKWRVPLLQHFSTPKLVVDDADKY